MNIKEIIEKNNLKSVKEWLKTHCINKKYGRDLETALMYAVKYDRFKIVELLLDNGADPSIKNMYNGTARDYVMSREMVELLERRII